MPAYSMIKAYKYIGLWTEVDLPKHMQTPWLLTPSDSPQFPSHRARKLWIASNTHSRVAESGYRYYFEDPREAVHFKLILDTL